ncbi:MAG: NADH-quinone oxidoreductase subunit NuoH [Verrucomicrobia bacterium]|nr:NADH-quinone oxidoreductase subunit NuoH [Verrucomicrobiota bacterium]
MAELFAKLDALPVTLKHLLMGLLPGATPEWLVSVVSAVLTITPILAVFPLMFALTTVIERKGLGRIQNRIGPNRVGIPLTDIRLWGFGQFIADGIKSLIKEDVVPRAADKVVHFLAPIALLIPVLLTYSVLPFGKNMVPLDLPQTGLLFFFAVGASTELSVFMAGWSSRNKYSLLGAMRAIAQMVSYEIPLILSSLTVVMMAGTLSLTSIVEHQAGTHFGFLHNWHLFTPWGFVGFCLFLTAAAAEANRTPFDLPEAESEIIAGYFTEYSGFKFAIFFLAEYLGLFAMCGLGITLFLGGWLPPVNIAPFTWVPSWCWFLGKLSALIVLFIWLRGTLPRLRTDQLMGFAWKFLLPMTLINLVVAALWHMSGGAVHIGIRWVVGFAMLAIPYWLLGRGFEASVGKRVYRFAN